LSSLPFSAEAESGFIAKLLVDPSHIPTLVGVVEPDDFHDEVMGQAWAVMVDNAGDPRRLDITVLRSKGIDLGDPLVFMQQGQASAESYATIIRTDAVKRRAILALESAKRMVKGAANEAGVYDAVSSATSTVLAQHRGGTIRTLAEAVADYRPTAGDIAWGMSALDTRIQPLGSGQMIVVAARPNVGKSAFLVELLLGMSRGSDKPVMFTTIEMSEHDVVKRLAFRAGGLGQFSEGYNLLIDDEPRATTASVRARAARVRLQHGGLKAIAIDYLQILKDVGEPDHVRVSRISGECKAIAREFGCPVIVLSQLNRQSESRDDRRPRLADLRDSGAIEQDADIVLGLYRPKLDSSALSLLVMKNRHGPAGGQIEMYFDLATVSVVEE